MALPTTQDMARHTVTQQHPITATWTPREKRLAVLAAEHQVDHELATNRAIAATRRDRFGPDLPAAAFLNSWQSLRPGLDVMLSIRYEDGDPTRPFVDLSVSNQPITEPNDIGAAKIAATDRFGQLRPRYLRWWTSQPAGSIPGTDQDKRFLAAPIHELIGQPVPEQLTLRATADLGNYDQAVAAYQSIDRAHPDHAGQATVETAEELAELAEAGTLYDVLLDGRWTGYVAAEPGHKLGLAGYKVAELVLAKTSRGHGYGRHLTTLLARALADTTDPDAVLIGTIHHHNTGALRAAQQAGRHDIGGWITVALK